jgi:hypothetical protein
MVKIAIGVFKYCHTVYRQSLTFGCSAFLQPARSYIINSYCYSIFHMQNSDSCTQPLNKHFEPLQSGAVNQVSTSQTKLFIL